MDLIGLKCELLCGIERNGCTSSWNAFLEKGNENEADVP